MAILRHLLIESICGEVPANEVDNLSLLGELVGTAKAAAVVKSTGFRTRRAMPPGGTVYELMRNAAENALQGIGRETVGGIVVVSFSAPERFPALSIRLQSDLGLGNEVAAMDLSLACGGYPYGLMVAGQLATVTGKRVLLVDGDVQSAHVDSSDPNTLAVMSDAATATVVSAEEVGAAADFAFYTDGTGGKVLSCGGDGKIRMDGFGVFRFVAGPVAKFLREFLECRSAPDWFVPHQANMYMVRQLAKGLGLEQGLITSGERYANPGSCSVALTLAAHPEVHGTALLAGFGAGLAAAAAMVTIPETCRRAVAEYRVA